jgi:hypothetical protein
MNIKKVLLTLLAAYGVFSLGAQFSPSSNLNADEAYGILNEFEVNGSTCQTRVGYGRITMSGRCSFDEVMTGIDRDDRILCSRLTVTCD